MLYAVVLHEHFEFINSQVECPLEELLEGNTKRVGMVCRNFPDWISSYSHHREPAVELLRFRRFELLDRIEISELKCQHRHVLALLGVVRLKGLLGADHFKDFEELLAGIGIPELQYFDDSFWIILR